MDVTRVLDSLRRLRGRVDNMVARAVIARVNDALKTQRLQITILDGEDEDDVEHLQPYGLSFVPPAGSQGVALAVGGARSHTVVLCVDSPGQRPTGGDGETGGLYTKGEWRVWIDSDGVVHVGGVEPDDESEIPRTDKIHDELAKIAEAFATFAPGSGGASFPDAYTFNPLTTSVASSKGKVT